ncbi:MAG: hypothetical protein Q4D51_12525 [Eubacteriales bacterium]|nr:hypothetical protein [Eubacteriales bacterium]
MDIRNVAAFAGYNVNIKTGNCDVSKSNWNRNDFPFWKYFEKATTAECLNSWKAKGKDISEWSDFAQNGAKSIGDSQITIIMPESLQKKMESDSVFALKIMEKVSTWKKNYDSADVAIGMANGESHSQAKMALQTGSYLIELDENGDVENYTVTTHGTEYLATLSNGEKKIYNRNTFHARKDTSDIDQRELITERESDAKESLYIEAMAVLSTGMRKI